MKDKGKEGYNEKQAHWNDRANSPIIPVCLLFSVTVRLRRGCHDFQVTVTGTVTFVAEVGGSLV
jgi:hypothetical protein